MFPLCQALSVSKEMFRSKRECDPQWAYIPGEWCWLKCKSKKFSSRQIGKSPWGRLEKREFIYIVEEENKRTKVWTSIKHWKSSSKGIWGGGNLRIPWQWGAGGRQESQESDLGKDGGGWACQDGALGHGRAIVGHSEELVNTLGQ